PAPRRSAGASSAESGFPTYDPLSFALARSWRDGDAVSVIPISIGARPVTSCPEGLGRGGKHHAREDHLRRRLRKPDRRLRHLALLSANRAPPAVAPDDDGGCLRAPKGPSNPTAQST